MKTPSGSRAIKLCGTEQPDVPGRVLRAGPISVELDNGQLRYLKVNDVEVLRAIGFLVRDENWGTYVPQLSELKIEQRDDGFSVTYHAVCRRGGQEIAFDVGIEGTPASLDFRSTAIPKTEFRTARTGFVVLHPLKGIVGNTVDVERVDGSAERSKFPEHVDPVQPFLHIRALTHEALPGVRASVRMEGDTWEMEDHRNWTDASFKTYVRPLALPWPYTLPAGEAVKQSVKVALAGSPPNAAVSKTRNAIEIRLGTPAREPMPPVGIGMPAEEIDHAIARLDLLKLLAPRFLVCHFDPRAMHGLEQLYGHRVLCEQIGADAVLEVVVENVDQYEEELQRVAKLVRESGLQLSALAVCPVGDLKSVLPGGHRPPAPALPALYAAARAAFPGVKLGGGMFSFFTELNRKRPPSELLDFVTNTTCPTVHAADDRSVMETLEALPYQVTTARSFIGKKGHRVGPSSIGCRDNPHGQTFTPNPDNERVCLARMDPRARGLFGAAWTLGYVATLARAGVEAIAIGAPTGPLGLIYRKTEYAQPYYDELDGTAVYPAFHVVAGLARAAGSKQVATTSSDSGTVASCAYKVKGATLLWLANLTARERAVSITGHEGGAMFAGILDEDSFAAATADPRAFEASHKPLRNGKIKLQAYAVAFLCINDD